MQIILMPHSMSRARPVTLTQKHIVLAAVGLLLGVLACAVLLNLMAARFAPGLPFMPKVSAAQLSDTDQRDRYLKENLSMMAVKLGEMQAQLMRLDALGERVQGLAGVKPEEFNFRELPGRGGMEPSAHHGGGHELGIAEFQNLLDGIAKAVERRSDYMNVVETALLGDKIRAKQLPTVQPVAVSYNASGFGWRLDPFSGRNAYHEGIDFSAASGTPIVAAAGGVVVSAEYHPQFGNMLEIDHGNDIMTRYAHASRLHSKVGDIVKRGQRIADIGSTGRSTGSHLHFEVHVRGVSQDPHKFLSVGGNEAKLLALSKR